MKIHKVIFFALLVLSLLFFNTFTINATGYISTVGIASDTKSLDKDITKLSGAILSTESFNTLFSGEPEKRSPTNYDELVKSSSSISNIRLDSDKTTLSVDVAVNVDGKTTLVPITGVLKSSYKSQNDINSIIVQVNNEINGFNVLLFEIFNDTAHDTLLLNNIGIGACLDGVPHIKLYLKDAQNNMLLFEDKLPLNLTHLIAAEYPRANKKCDGLWALPYVDVSIISQGDVGVEQQTEQDRVLGGESTWSSTAYRYTSSYYLSNDYYEHSSYPAIKMRHENVRSATEPWEATIMIYEFTRVSSGNYVEYYYGSNPIEYYNPKIQFVCGDQSAFTSAELFGKLYKNSVLGDLIPAFGSTLSVVCSELIRSTPIVGAIYDELLNLLDVAENMTKNLTFGDRINFTGDEYVTGHGIYLDGAYMSESTNHDGEVENGDFLQHRVFVKRVTGSGSRSTVGALVVSFDIVNIYDGSEVAFEQSFRLSYSLS